MKTLLSTILLTIYSFNFLIAQNLTGHVFDVETKHTLTGATVFFNGEYTTTNSNGEFMLSLKKRGELRVSYTGYQSFSETIKLPEDKTSFDVSVALVRLDNSLNNVEITTISNRNKSLLSQPSSITRLTPVELKRGTGLFLDDAINENIPGVTMQRRAVSSGQQFNIRGYGNGTRGTRGISSNFDGQGYKVYLNGIPITDAEGITVLDDIDYSSIGNVEMSKGPSGTLYGLSIAGVVNLQTATPEPGKTSVGQDVLAGNYGLQRYTTHFATAGAHYSLLINYGYQGSKGFMSHSKSHKNFVNAIGNFKITDKESINFYAGYSNSYDQRSGELSIAQYDSMNYAGNIAYIQRNAHSEVISYRAGFGHTYNFNKNISNTTTLFAIGAPNNASSAGGWTDKDPFNYGLRSVFNTQFALKNSMSLTGVTGVETQQQRAQTIGYGMADTQGATHVWNYGDPYFIITAATSNVFSISSTTSVFTEWTWALQNNLSFTGGLGLSNMKIKLYDRFYVADKPTYFEKNYGGMLSPHLAINKVFSKQFSVYAAYSRGYKAPVSSYFYIPYAVVSGSAIAGTGIINTNLKPEVANQLELGTKGNLMDNKLFYQVAVYDIMYKNKMTSVAVPNTSNTAIAYSYVVNGGKQDHKGLEVLVKYTAYQSATGFVQTFKPFANASWVDYVYKDYLFPNTVIGKPALNYNGFPVAGVPKFTTSAGFDANFAGGIYMNMMYSYKSKLPITSGSNGGDTITQPIYTTSYNLLNGKIGIRQSFGHFDLDAYFGIDNITNTQYPYMVFVNQQPDSYLPAPLKANYYGGINLKYNF